tara:strand:- start:1078 stop:2112 length:1035 start_codon:yes stop_codon:yes gene_type:complete
MENPLDQFNWDSGVLQPEDAIPEDAGLKLELRKYDVREDSKGNKIPLETGKTREFRIPVDKDHGSAMVVTKTYFGDRTLKNTELVIRSPHIRTAMVSAIKKYPGVSLTEEKITVIGEPRCLFHFRKELLAYGRGLTERTAAQHVAFALNYMQTTLAHDLVHYNNCIAKHGEAPGLDFARLWMQYRPGELIFVDSSSMPWVGRLSHMIRTGIFVKRWELILERIMWTGSKLQYFDEEVTIMEYDGFKRFKDLSAYPLKYHPEYHSIRQTLLERGNKYLALRGVHQRYYSGTSRWASDRKGDYDNEDDCRFEKFKVRPYGNSWFVLWLKFRPVGSKSSHDRRDRLL